ncbi:MAG: CopG family transcriptional regulator [Chloroflexi bacterium]|nr:CopG family transcriptional regulator [Chloroflexota bacterium]
MAKAKIAVTVDEELVREIDRWVAAGEFRSRSSATQEALRRLRIERSRRSNLLRELAKLDPAEEKALAEEWFVGETPWPEY